MGVGIENIRKNIQSYKKRYYLNIFIKGGLLSAAILISYFLVAAIMEYVLWLSPWARVLIFANFFILTIYCIVRFLKDPLRFWFARKGLTEEESAVLIGQQLGGSKDKLLNLIQLASGAQHSVLAQAGVQQKAQEFETLSFDKLIDISKNKIFARYLILPALTIIAILIFDSRILTSSTNRIVHFGQEFSPEAPFQFIVDSKKLVAYFNEDFTLQTSFTGDAIPSEVYLTSGNQRIKLQSVSSGGFAYTFENVQSAFDFQLEAAGFFSETFHVSLVNRPELTNFSLTLEYPRYLQRQNQKLNSTGNLEIPEGTTVHWNLNTFNTEKVQILFASENQEQDFNVEGSQSFSFQKTIKNPDQYEIKLLSDSSGNKEKILYHIDVIKDQYPQIAVSNFRDSILYQRIILGGSIGDDYGVSQLALFFRVRNEKQEETKSHSVNIPIANNQLQQNFFYNWSLDTIQLNPGDQLDYYLQVWDNDGVNGRKSTKTASYTFFIPTKDNLVTEISRSQNEAQEKIEESSTKADKLQEKIEEAQQKLKGKQNLDWQDKKMLEDIIQQKNELQQQIEKMQEENKLLEQKKENLSEQDKRIREKAEQLQKLMDELLDEETKKLFEELQKLMNEKKDPAEMQKLLDKLNQNTSNLEKELERTLELFKQLQFDYKLDQTVQELKQQVEQQKSLLERTEQLETEQQKADKQKNNEEQKQANQKESEELAKDQEELQKEFEKTQEKIDELKELDKEIDKDADLPSEEEQKEIDQNQEESKEQLKQNQPSKSKAPQQKAVQKMQKMQQQMESSQSSMQMEMDMQNIESLRQIIHGLVKLSFDQEGIMKSFADLNQSDPRFNVLAQQQLKLKDDAKVLEDSLLALGKRDPFMGSVVTKEVGELNNHLDKTIEANHERRRPVAASEMQFTMTAINNLALMLDDHFDMMMQMMANAQPSMGKSKNKGKKPSLSQLQQQLNQKIQDLKGSGKSGREMSEQLAEMAAEQERIRKALEEMQDKMGEEGKMPGGDLPGKMEQTEMDLVNKQLTDQLIKRQQDILTRLLQAEKSMREQDLDDERKGETAKDYNKEIPKAFEEYLRLKEKEVELLKTVPPKLYPYYKKEVSEYFKRMNQ